MIDIETLSRYNKAQIENEIIRLRKKHRLFCYLTLLFLLVSISFFALSLFSFVKYINAIKNKVAGNFINPIVFGTLFIIFLLICIAIFFITHNRYNKDVTELQNYLSNYERKR